MAADAADTARTSKEGADRVRQVMAEQQRAMETQAEASKALATAAIASERAFVFLDTSSVTGLNDASDFKPAMRRKLYFVNLGKTPALVQGVHLSFKAFFVGEVEDFLQHPNAAFHSLGFWLGPGITSDPYTISLTITEEDLVRLTQNRAILGLLGRLFYMDVFGNRRETGFAVQMTEAGDIITAIDNPRLNYGS